MMRLPSCINAVTSLKWHPVGACVLGFVRQTMHNMCYISDHFFCVVQIQDAAGIWSKAKQAREENIGRTGNAECECQGVRPFDAGRGRRC